MAREISPMEISLVKWIERIMTPLFIAMIVGLTTCAAQTRDQVNALDSTVETLSEQTEDRAIRQKETIKQIQVKQNTIINKVDNVQDTTIRLEADVGNMKDDVTDIKRLLERAYPIRTPE
jgi:hypothetical protein